MEEKNELEQAVKRLIEAYKNGWGVAKYIDNLCHIMGEEPPLFNSLDPFGLRNLIVVKLKDGITWRGTIPL